MADGKVPPGEALGSSSAVPAVGGAERGHSVMERGRVCFSCRRSGHGVNRCSRFSVLVAGLVGGCPRWPISSDTNRRNWNVVYSGKRGMVRAGGSASRIIGDGSTTDPGGGDGGSKRGRPAWQLPAGHGLRPSRTLSMHAFPPLGSHPTDIRGQDNRQLPVWAKVVLGNRNPIVPDPPIRMDRTSLSVVPPQCPELGNMGGGCGLPVGIGGLHRE